MIPIPVWHQLSRLTYTRPDAASIQSNLAVILAELWNKPYPTMKVFYAEVNSIFKYSSIPTKNFYCPYTTSHSITLAASAS